MPYLKKICRYLISFTLSILTVLIIGYFTPAKWCNSSQANCHFTICVSNTGIHTNIVVPVKNEIFDWQIYLKRDDFYNNDTEFPYKYLSFGWGDRAFYMTTPTLAQLNLITTFNALFLPTPSVMDVQWYQTFPNNIKNKCVRVSNTDYLILMKFINDSFQLDAEGKKIRISPGYSSHSSFYEAKGSYSILRTCNSWTAEGLQKANVNTPLWAGLSSAIMLHLNNSCECSQ